MGTVKDAETGEPLIGANVLIEGTQRGAATDKNGRYFILHVPPGTYNLRAQMIGYATVIKRNVTVQVDLTSQVNFALALSAVEGQEVVVVAERPLIQQDITAKVSIVSHEDIDAMPISDFRQALQIQGGFTDGLHLRGGRLNSVGYRIDGLDVTNPLIGNYEGVQNDRSETLGLADNQLFASAYVSDRNSSNYDGILLDKNAIQEIQVLTGTFNAEYGRAMSGVVNVVTKDPSPSYHFQLEYLSPMVNESPYRKPDGVAPDENPGPDPGLSYSPWRLQDHFSQWDRQFLGQFRGTLSGAVPLVPHLTFLASGRMLNENSSLPFGYNIVRDAFEKFVYAPVSAFKITVTGNQTRKSWQPYNHDWKYLPDHYSHFQRSTNRFTLELTHTLSSKTFYTLKLSRLQTQYKRNVPGLNVTIDTNAYPHFDPVQTDYRQPERWENGFFYRGDDISIENSKTITRNVKFDITSQLHPSHLVKAGVDLLDHDIRQFIYRNPYSGGVHEFQNYKRRPLEIGAYVQDKIEYNFLIINLGLRMDYFNPNGLGKGSRQVNDPSYPYDNETVTMWPDLYIPGYIDNDGHFQYFPEKKAPAQVYFSPRIGVAHPVTESLSLHFAYGHFVQRPDFRDIFFTHDIQRAFRLVGNPRAKMQKTVAFEVGLKQAIANIIAVDISVYYRDIFDLLGS
ncbi:MAG: TonB-dependent receptor, partial [Calditrichaeota bacterium]